MIVVAAAAVAAVVPQLAPVLAVLQMVRAQSTQCHAPRRLHGALWRVVSQVETRTAAMLRKKRTTTRIEKR